MSGGYIGIAGILLYLLLIRKLDSPNMNPVKAATIWVVSYYLLLFAVLALESVLRGHPLDLGMASLAHLATAVLQFIAMAGVFVKVQDSGDDYASYLLWGGAGLALVFFVVPTLAERLFIGL